MTKSEGPSPPESEFDPHTLPKYSVIRLPFKFSGAAYHEPKRFVVLGHRQGHAICIKATSNVAFYNNNAGLLAGCVYYRAGEVPLFEKDTVIQPDNQVAIPHDEIRTRKKGRELDVLGTLPDQFEPDLLDAIEDSITLSGSERKIILNLIKS